MNIRGMLKKKKTYNWQASLLAESTLHKKQIQIWMIYLYWQQYKETIYNLSAYAFEKKKKHLHSSEFKELKNRFLL